LAPSRLVLAVILTIGLLGTPRLGAAQQPTKVPRIGWLSNASRTPEVSHLLEAFSQGLRELGYVEGQNIAIEYRFAEGRPERLPGFAAELLGLKVDIIVTPNPTATQAAQQATRTVPIHRARIARLAATNRLPTVAGTAEAGCLVTYGRSLSDDFRHAATYVDKILKGARPADLPVEQPTKFELVINLKTAKALGLTIPPPVLAQADELIR
jgi:ABC-type uncharacterized transport system substrate-binding protein